MPHNNADRIEYLDFDCEIAQGDGQVYPLKLLRSPGGEASGTFRLPFGESELRDKLKDIQIAVLRSSVRRRRVLLPHEQAAREFGQRLFDALFAGELRGSYDVARDRAAREGKGLRLKLRIQPPELAALPWELLFDTRHGEYVCMFRRTTLVRYIDLQQATEPLRVVLPLRVLAMVASPADLAPLDVIQERARLEQALQPLRECGMVELAWVDGQTWRDLRRTVQHGPWHVLHMIGHGGYSRDRDEGFIALADEQGNTYRLWATALARLIDEQHALRLALLNVCDGARGSSRDLFSLTRRRTRRVTNRVAYFLYILSLSRYSFSQYISNSRVDTLFI